MLSSGRSSELSSLISRPGDRTSFPSSKQPGSNNDITGNKKSPKKQTGANANGITTRSATLPNLRARHSFAKENMERIASKGDDDPLESSRKRKRTGKLSLAPAHASLVTRKVGKGKGKGKVSERNAHKAQTSKLEACDGEEDFHEPECSTSTLREGSSSNVHVIRPIFSNDSSKFPSQANKKGRPVSPVAPAWKRHSEPSSDEDGPKSTRTFDTELSTHSALHDQPYSLDAQLRAVMDEVTFPNGTLKATEALSVLEPLGSLYAPDVMNGSIESHQEVKEEEQPRQIYQFDLDAMLSDAMAKAASQVHTEQQSMSIAPSMLTLPPSTFNTVETMGGIKVKEEEIEDVHGDDKSDSPNFDLDAHLNVAMASNSHAMSEAATEPSSHEMSSDEDEGFDLDAQIGAAMGSLVPSLEGVATTTPAAALRAQKNPRGKGAGGGDAGGITADELQAMLRGAMQQATKELELDEEDYEDIDAEFLEGEVFSERPFVLPSKPRIRPSVEDDGNPENAFNRARPHHYQALPYAFACSFPKCDNVFSRPDNLRMHQATHIGDKPYKCSKCPLAFTTNQDFRFHYRTHDNTRSWRYRCKGCHNLFSERDMLDKHASTDTENASCKKGQYEFDFRPPPPKPRRLRPSTDEKNHQISPEALHESTPPPYFRQTQFNANRLLASTLVSQLSSLLAQQYERQNSLLTPADGQIDINVALLETLRKTGLTLRETAALATVLASVAHARNEGLQASLFEARKAQANAIKQHQEMQLRQKMLLEQKAKGTTSKKEKEGHLKPGRQDEGQLQTAQSLAKEKKESKKEESPDIPVPI